MFKTQLQDMFHITCISGAVTDETAKKAQNETTKHHFSIDYTKPPIPKASSFPQPLLTLPSGNNHIFFSFQI